MLKFSAAHVYQQKSLAEKLFSLVVYNFGWYFLACPYICSGRAVAQLLT